ncbi:MAG: bifunctional DNA-formamidopyrimidine glycosylase/DNA-(apurinic or apyrimidinic site) lyase [Myxococcales bacterium]|nr:bifunctional DNA-formamidopyrimidine glycosylase/DNA-(apurinic or apyrimidinic site) lyase [Myxococcales bacterium]MDD9971758.1 bifunctional DNA-formamidopyrimidine glycosylase/DNA-(apurinic or apyrimidinic site) lyase [Myxococcales bacterium]
MPELPEVEITLRKLRPALVGRSVSALDTSANSYFFVTPPNVLKRGVEGRRAVDLVRRGKYLVLLLDDGRRLLLHLGMTGQLFVAGEGSVELLPTTGRGTLKPSQQQRFSPDKHTHLVFRLTGDGGDVYFRDPRKFGKVQLLGPRQPCERLDKLGPDALGVTAEHLRAAARGRRGAVKGLLLNQAVLAGVGNIYADEALFLARIRPGRAAGRVTRAEHEALAQALRSVLQRSIETGGSSISDYVHPDGQRGSYQLGRMVYARAGEPCSQCGATIAHRTVAQRSSHYCPSCQR